MLSRATRLFIVLFCTTLLPKQASALELFSLRYVDIQYVSYFPGSYDPMLGDDPLLPGHTLDKAVNFRLNFDVLRYVYWDNLVHSRSDLVNGGSGQFREVGWQFELGVKLFDSIRAGYFHHSQHLLDATSPYHFPVEDGLTFHLILYSREKDGLIHL